MSETLPVLIEIPEGSNVKYELNEHTGQIYVDRLMPTAMSYPVNYGLIEDTLGEDGDALDALVFISAKIVPGVVIKCKVIGMLGMEDEEGVDNKIICVPATTKIDPICGAWESLDDIPNPSKAAIKHFFEHYKDLEKDKWVKLTDWSGPQPAWEIIRKSQEKYQAEVEAFAEEIELAE